MMLVPSALTWGSGDQSCEPPLWLRRLFCFQCGTASTTALEAPVANSVAEVSLGRLSAVSRRPLFGQLQCQVIKPMMLAGLDRAQLTCLVF